ncbi:MAG: hypothetical protein A2987_01665 [Omnitrophica bacterium RIFCSPLOWO2_01_FULL_45_10]|nr:MAG: hypothetical protein A2987_01665 [Omnitrophica bacterium RIFCSPLOWO2_01_FULL_45_10]
MIKQREALSNISRNKNFTAFEKKVYRAICEIPPGEARSYKWVARRIGRGRAYRAVGKALNKNPYPVTIPCHRVVKSDGGIGGYSRGAKLKRRLLKREGVDLRVLRV